MSQPSNAPPPSVKPSERPQPPAFTKREQLFIQAQRLAPQQLLSMAMYHIARSRWTPLKKLLIEQVIRRYQVDMSSAAEPDPSAYPSFNDFFTRALRPDARPLPSEPGALCSPADGRISQFGAIHDGQIIQAKGHSYSVEELLGGESSWSKLFQKGQFMNIYLSPQDYHRIHMPRSGILHRTVQIPGKLFSVNPLTTRAVPNLFARNERLCSLFESDVGPMAVVLVGAIFVSSMETVWGGEYLRSKQIITTDFGPPTLSVELQRGEEMGRFNMGSTVILLFPPHTLHWAEKLKRGMHVKMGQRIAGVIHREAGGRS